MSPILFVVLLCVVGVALPYRSEKLLRFSRGASGDRFANENQRTLFLVALVVFECGVFFLLCVVGIGILAENEWFMFGTLPWEIVTGFSDATVFLVPYVVFAKGLAFAWLIIVIHTHKPTNDE